MFYSLMGSGDSYKFTAKDFYALLEKQQYRCRLSGRELTPENTDGEHILPLELGGQHQPENICLVVRDVARLKRHLTEQAVVELCYDIIKQRGLEFDFKVSKVS